MDVTILREALQTVPNHNCELIVKAISEKLANTLGEQVITNDYLNMISFYFHKITYMSTCIVVHFVCVFLLISVYSR